MKNYYTIFTTNHTGKRCTLNEHYTQDNMRYILINDNTGVAHCSDEYETIPLIMEMYNKDDEPYTLYQRSIIVAKIAGDEFGDMTNKSIYVRDDLYVLLATRYPHRIGQPRYTVYHSDTNKYLYYECVVFTFDDELIEVNVTGDSKTSLTDDCFRALARLEGRKELERYTYGLYSMMRTCENIQEEIDANESGLFSREAIDSCYDTLYDVIDMLTDATTTLEEDFEERGF